MIKGDQSTYRIARQQDVTPRYVRMLYKRYQNTKPYLMDQISLKKCGRKPKPMTPYEVAIVTETKNTMHFGAVNLEKVLLERGIVISHNRIHNILLQEGLANNEPKKQKRRKWIRYKRPFSNYLWHTDYHELSNGGYIIPFEDDASRFITGYGVFPNQTAKNAVSVLQNAIVAYGTPKQLLSDHGTQFTSLKRENCSDPEENEFQKKLREYNIQHILARVKHPQTNGKMERWFGTLERLLIHFDGNVDRAVQFYNFKRPHMSLENGHLRTPYEAFLDKMRKNYKVMT
jgi:putative transposase